MAEMTIKDIDFKDIVIDPYEKPGVYRFQGIASRNGTEKTFSFLCNDFHALDDDEIKNDLYKSIDIHMRRDH